MAKPTGKPTGRPPVTYCPIVGEQICERLATSSKGLRWILEDLISEGVQNVPPLHNIWKWLEREEGFREQYARARELQATVIHDEAQHEAETLRMGSVKKTTKKGDKTESTDIQSDSVQRSALIVQTMLKRAGQLNPKKYGDKVTHAGDSDSPVSIVIEHIGSAAPKEAKPQKK